jgi:hypothetical protein
MIGISKIRISDFMAFRENLNAKDQPPSRAPSWRILQCDFENPLIPVVKSVILPKKNTVKTLFAVHDKIRPILLPPNR